MQWLTDLQQRLTAEGKNLGGDFTAALMIGVLDRYARTLQRNGGKLMLAGVSAGVALQLERTGLVQLLGRDNVFAEQAQWGAAANQALAAAQAWLESLPDEPVTTSNRRHP